MHSCESIRQILERQFAGEANAADLQVLKEHLPGCPDCAALALIRDELVGLEQTIEVPEPEAFRHMRARVLGQLARGESGAAKPARPPLVRWMPALAAAATLVLGVFIGNWMSRFDSIDDELLIRTISRQASADAQLEDSWETPLFFSDVSVEGFSDQRVSLGFNVCRSLDLNTSLASPLAANILTHAILNSDSLGGRMRAMEIAALSNEQRLTRALAVVLQQEGQQSLRIEALRALSRKEDSEQVMKALKAALRDDPSVQVRLMALEQLANKSVAPEELETLIRQGGQETNPALMQRAREIRTGGVSENWL